MASNSQVLTDLASIIGWEGVAAMVRLAGGQARNIPRTATREHWLTVFLGVEKAQLLCDRYGGEILYVPKDDIGVRALRNQRIKQLRGEGASIHALATEFKLTDRQIYAVLAVAEG